MRACPACGASNDPTDDFCGNCGAYLGWSDDPPTPSTPSAAPSEPEPEPPAPSTPAEPPAAPEAAPAPPSPPADEPASTEHTRNPSLRTRLTGRTRGEAQETNRAPTAAPPSDLDPDPGPAPADEPTSTEPTRNPSLRTRLTGRTRGEARETNTAQPATAPPSHLDPDPEAAPAQDESASPASEDRTQPPAPVPPAAPARAPEAPAPDAVVPVQPAKPVAPRPVVRPVEVPGEVAGAPCPSCGTPNPPDRRFCRRCATPLKPTAKADPLPWWRTVWPFRRRVRASSGRGVRLLVILAVVLALCAGAVLLLPAGRALFEDTRDKLADAKAVTPVRIVASAEVPGHPAKNSMDGLSNRYWGAPAPGASVTYTFRKPFRLVDVLITNGASKEPEDYAREGRALQVDLEVTAQDGERHDKQLTLSDKPGSQTIPTGISDVKTVRLVLRSATGLAPGRHLALAEVEFFQRA